MLFLLVVVLKAKLLVLVTCVRLVFNLNTRQGASVKMYIDLESRSKLQPYVEFDWRLVAERGLRCYGHFHNRTQDLNSVATCEISFLQKARLFRFSQLPIWSTTKTNFAFLFPLHKQTKQNKTKRNKNTLALTDVTGGQGNGSGGDSE